MQFNVQISYATEADSAEEAVRIALAATAGRSGAYVEVFDDEASESVAEGDLDSFKDGLDDDDDTNECEPIYQSQDWAHEERYGPRD